MIHLDDFPASKREPDSQLAHEHKPRTWLIVTIVIAGALLVPVAREIAKYF